MGVYEKCPEFESENYIVRLLSEKDTEDLWNVYKDKNALPFFNSDNCHGDNFFCEKLEYIQGAVKYWLIEYYENKGFVRFTIVDKNKSEAIGTIEMFRRVADDYYNNYGLLRLDLRIDYELENCIKEILELVTQPFYGLFECSSIATKAAVYAVERIEALKNSGYVKSEEPLIGQQDRKCYYDYWVIEKAKEV